MHTHTHSEQSMQELMCYTHSCVHASHTHRSVELAHPDNNTGCLGVNVHDLLVGPGLDEMELLMVNYVMHWFVNVLSSHKKWTKRK